jgi:hypothetical protein
LGLTEEHRQKLVAAFLHSMIRMTNLLMVGVVNVIYMDKK